MYKEFDRKLLVSLGIATDDGLLYIHDYDSQEDSGLQQLEFPNMIDNEVLRISKVNCKKLYKYLEETDAPIVYLKGSNGSLQNWQDKRYTSDTAINYRKRGSDKCVKLDFSWNIKETFMEYLKG